VLPDPIKDKDIPYTKKINLVYHRSKDKYPDALKYHHQTPTPEGWEAYDGSIYTPERGYGWLTDLLGQGRDRGTDGIVVLAGGTVTSPRDMGRPELANFHGRHQESRLLVFRIDLSDGWYRVSCTSIDPNWSRRKPLVDQRSFKCRAHDVVFAGANYGRPLVVGGRDLVEGAEIVEVTDGHLRIVVGDPAYAGWVWNHDGPWYEDLKHWWRVEYNYANGWYQRLTRTVDPGFHGLDMNSLEVERVAAPAERPSLVFRDFFNRDDSPDVNEGVAEANRWEKVTLHPRIPDHHRTELYKTSIKFTGPKSGTSIGGLLQQEPSPAGGIIRYSTRVSLFAGEGSQKHSGGQEAGIVMLADPAKPNEFNSTFVGVAVDSGRSETIGWLIYRVGNGNQEYRTNLEIPDTALPFKIREGEFEVIVEHDVTKNLLRQIRVNGVDVTEKYPLKDRTQRISQGLFGIRSAIDNTNPRASLKQFYWYYRVEALTTGSTK
jgi:hypothetical protein